MNSYLVAYPVWLEGIPERKIPSGSKKSLKEKFSATGLAQELQVEFWLVSRCPPPACIFGVCQARLFEPLSLFFFFLSGGPGLAGWILYRSASLVVDACCNKIPPNVRPLGFVAIYRLVSKWLLLLFVPNPNSVPSLFTPALELRAGPLEDPSQEV